ncbi:MAG: hypothetical protein ACLTDC_04100 [Lachnospiraceae bacterium]
MVMTVFPLTPPNISDGYVMIRYTGRSEKAKAQITIPDGTVYTYTIKGSDYNTFPLTGGNGDYTLKVYEWVVDNSYALAFFQGSLRQPQR